MAPATKNRIADLASSNGADTPRAVTIPAPNMQVALFDIEGTAPYAQYKFSARAREQLERIVTRQDKGGKGTKAKRPAHDFDAEFAGSYHVSTDGWCGIPATSFRAGLISACRLVGFKMTIAKLAVFIQADGLDAETSEPLVRLIGPDPEKNQFVGRNADGSPQLRARALWKTWRARLRIEFDADQFALEDIANLLSRVGQQVGIGCGRPDSRDSAGIGWGLFRITEKEKAS